MNFRSFLIYNSAPAERPNPYITIQHRARCFNICQSLAYLQITVLKVKASQICSLIYHLGLLTVPDCVIANTGLLHIFG